MESTFQWNSKTKVDFLRKLPSRSRLTEALEHQPEKILVVYDRRLIQAEGAKTWLKSFDLAYPVAAGERLKDLSTFSSHVRKLFKQLTPFSGRSLCVVGVGGGSVGDFAGFLSSVLKRGVPLVHIPTTLLAAMDSSHGGKTALNVGDFKNQIGTFNPADAVMIVRSLFEGLPNLQIHSAQGELVKMAFLSGGELYEQIVKTEKVDLDAIWSLLPKAIEAKYVIVEQDPFEKLGPRQLLNLGHSLGHGLESYYGLAHGVAVGQGLIFAIDWSVHQGFLAQNLALDFKQLLIDRLGFLSAKDFAKKHRPMARKKLARLIAEDKKLTDARHLNFIFLEGVGRAFRKVVTLESLLTETQRQGWTSV